jgi:hypothetical protein
MAVTWRRFGARWSVSARRKAEGFELQAPLRWRVAQPFDAESPWQPPFDRSLDETGCEEGKRDRRVDVALAALLTRRDLSHIGDFARYDLVEPAVPSRDRTDETGAAGLAGKKKLLCIGTSATMSNAENDEARNTAVAEVGSKLFGELMGPNSIIDEHLARVTDPTAHGSSLGHPSGMRLLGRYPRTLATKLSFLTLWLVGLRRKLVSLKAKSCGGGRR